MRDSFHVQEQPPACGPRIAQHQCQAGRWQSRTSRCRKSVAATDLMSVIEARSCVMMNSQMQQTCNRSGPGWLATESGTKASSTGLFHLNLSLVSVWVLASAADQLGSLQLTYRAQRTWHCSASIKCGNFCTVREIVEGGDTCILTCFLKLE